MATVTSRYPGVCPLCRASYPVGTEVRKDSDSGKWAHAECPASSGARRQAAPARRSSVASRSSPAPRSTFPATPPEEGAHQVSGRRTGRGDRRYEVGGVIHGPRVAVPGGGPDGHWYTVLACQLTPPCEDAGQYEWREHAWVRAATDEEAAAPAAAHVARGRRQEALAEVQRLVRTPEAYTEESLPPGRDVVLYQSLAGHRLLRLAEDGSVWESLSSYDDGPRAWRTTDTRAAELMRELLG